MAQGRLPSPAILFEKVLDLFFVWLCYHFYFSTIFDDFFLNRIFNLF